MHWGTFKYFLEQVIKNSFKNSFECKNDFWEKKTCNPFGFLLQILHLKEF